MEATISALSPEAIDTLRRYASYGWMPAVIAKLLNRRFPLSLNARDVALLLAELPDLTESTSQNAPSI